MQEPGQLADYIVEQLGHRGPMTGSQLGAAILAAPEFHGLDIKLRYGGLRQAIALICQGQVCEVGASGGDQIYDLASGAQAPSPAAGRASAGSLDAPSSLWQVFLGLARELSRELVWLPASGELSIGPQHDCAEGGAIVPNMTIEDHLDIARTFARALPEAERLATESILQTEDYWPRWKHYIDSHADQSVQRNWLRHRFAAIESVFRARMANICDDEEAVDNAWRQLEASRRRTPRPARYADARPNPSITGPAELRTVVKAVVDGLSPEELRRIWLPLGLVSDVMYRNTG